MPVMLQVTGGGGGGGYIYGPLNSTLRHVEYTHLSTLLLSLWHVGTCKMATDRNAPQGVLKVHCECKIESESNDWGRDANRPGFAVFCYGE